MGSHSLTGQPGALPSLPKDIGRVIFELLAETGDTASALVSREVQKWTEPILYCDVVLNHPKKGELFYRTVTTFGSSPASRKPSNFLASHVKGLFIHRHHTNHKHISAILQACPSITALQWPIWHTDGEPRDLVSPTHLRLQQMPGLVIPDPNTGKLFELVSHLDLGTYWTVAHDWTMIASLPRLTHLILGVRPTMDLAEVTRMLFSSSKNLRAFLFLDYRHLFKDGVDDCAAFWDVDDRAVLATTSNESWSSKPLLHDGKVLNLGTMAEYVSQWYSVTTVGQGYWVRAEALIEERRQRRLESGTCRD